MYSLKKGLMVFAVTVCMVCFSGTLVMAAPSTPVNVQAYSGVKIIYNGKELTDASQPYIINSTTYIPLRMLMNNFGKNVAWDSVNNRVIITDGSADAAKEAQITQLKNTITTLNAKIAQLEAQLEEDEEDIKTSDIKKTLEDEFEKLGKDYFNDSGIELASVSVSGDEDEITFTLKVDFGDANKYDSLEDLDEDDIEDLLEDVVDCIEDEIDGTDFEGADITGRLVDYDDSSSYVKYAKGSYTYSWDDEISSSSLQKDLEEEFEDAGYNYFDDEGIELASVKIRLDEDEVYYTIKLDLDDSEEGYEDLEDLDEDDLEDFIEAVRDFIEDQIDGTDYEDAEINGRVQDYNSSSLYVEDNDGDLEYSWE